ncbi:hypothetical protein BDV19DRAFT_392569 [Aspergillus venezuelensis]
MASLVHCLEAPIEGYGIWEPEWEIEYPPGQTFQSNGTVEEVYSRLAESHPEWDESYFKPALARLTQPASSSSSSSSSPAALEKRTDFYNDGWLVCGQWPGADRPRIQEGINYLRLVPGRPGNGPGPGNCGRVSCSYNAAIWWCNDVSFLDSSPSDAIERDHSIKLTSSLLCKSPQFKQLESYDSIADGADALMSCVVSIGWYDQVAGQAFHNTNWNVIVRGDSC